MAKIFITGSSDGIGLLAAKALIEQGHRVVLHARNETRAQDALRNAPGAEAVLTGDLSRIDETVALAAKVNELGPFDAIIHNAGISDVPGEMIFAVNTLAPYILTCLIEPPKRLVYIGSKLHLGGQAKLDSIPADLGSITYSDSKVHVLMLSNYVARHWPQVLSNVVHPGWVPTKMGGASATDDLQKGYETQVWLAIANDKEALASGRYFFHRQESRTNPEADDTGMQDRLIRLCAEISGVTFPEK